MILGDRMRQWMMKKFSFIQEEYKFILFLILFYCILQIPVNYYITTGGGISDVSSRIRVEEKHESKGSFNISYVTELQKSTVLTYALSYVIPTWERESANSYKYSEEESTKDIQLRSEMDLEEANSTATYWAYTLAGKEINRLSTHIYVAALSPQFETPLKVGDEIVSIDGIKKETITEYKEYFQTKKENDSVTVQIIRNAKPKEVTTTLYSYEDRLILGISLQLIHEYETNPKVDISFKETESGPSGGLITTLEIYNQLIEEDLTKGRKIAGTGTIEEDGTIGEIGGIRYKLLGAVSAKADIFLVPSGKNYEDVIEYQKEKKLKIKLIEVKSIEDAIEKLKK